MLRAGSARTCPCRHYSAASNVTELQTDEKFEVLFISPPPLIYQHQVPTSCFLLLINSFCNSAVWEPNQQKVREYKIIFLFVYLLYFFISIFFTNDPKANLVRISQKYLPGFVFSLIFFCSKMQQLPICCPKHFKKKNFHNKTVLSQCTTL